MKSKNPGPGDLSSLLNRLIYLNCCPIKPSIDVCIRFRLPVNFSQTITEHRHGTEIQPVEKAAGARPGLDGQLAPYAH